MKLKASLGYIGEFEASSGCMRLSPKPTKQHKWRCQNHGLRRWVLNRVFGVLRLGLGWGNSSVPSLLDSPTGGFWEGKQNGQCICISTGFKMPLWGPDKSVEHCLFSGKLSTVLVLFSTDIEKCISQVINDKYQANRVMECLYDFTVI